MSDESNLNLDAMSPAQASERLSQLLADTSWRDAYLSGSGRHVKEFNALADRGALTERFDDIVAGTNTPAPGGPNVAGVSRANVASAAGWLHDAGLSDGAISELLHGTPISEEDFRILEPQVRENFFGNKEWVRRLMEGGAAEFKQLLAWNIIKTNRKSAYGPTIAGR